MKAPLALLFCVLPATSNLTSALEPKNVFLLVNKNVPASKDVAEHYCKQRSVPLANIITLDLPSGEDISRKDYDAKIVIPVREALKEKKQDAKVLLSIYGIPLRVGGQDLNEEEREKLKKLDAEIEPLRKEEKKYREKIAELEKKKVDPDGANALMLTAQQDKLKKIQSQLNPLNRRRSFLTYSESHACVDSELMLLWWDKYELRRWQVNLLYFQIPEKAREGKPSTVMTCRLDGPTPEIAKRLVDDSIEVEKTGLSGKVYVDARGIRFDPKSEPQGTGYGGYDESMREMARLLQKEGKMPVILDDKGELFPVGSCTDCALYCGWYSHANFIDCCKFVKGAVAWHLASSEAVSLHSPNVKYWCKNQLEKGAAATLGPVAEPYTIGFPKPEEFFGFLATGKYTLVESYSRTVMLNSWMGVLVGDPLYNPFAKKPALKEDDVKPSPQGAKFPFRVR